MFNKIASEIDPVQGVTLREIPGRTHMYEVAEPYTYTTLEGEKITVPEGFETDLASIPRFMWPIVGPHELGFTAPAVHDYLRSLPGYSGGVKRLKADKIFAEIMLRQKVADMKRNSSHSAVKFWTAKEGIEKKLRDANTFQAALAGVAAGSAGGFLGGSLGTQIADKTFATIEGESKEDEEGRRERRRRMGRLLGAASTAAVTLPLGAWLGRRYAPVVGLSKTADDRPNSNWTTLSGKSKFESMENYRQLARQITLAGLLKLATGASSVPSGDPLGGTTNLSDSAAAKQAETMLQAGRSGLGLLGLMALGSGAGLIGGGFGGYKLGELVADKTYGAVPGEDPVEREKELRNRRIIGGVVGMIPGALVGKNLGRSLTLMTPYANNALDNIAKGLDISQSQLGG